jgi:hypothetical protein
LKFKQGPPYLDYSSNLEEAVEFSGKNLDEVGLEDSSLISQLSKSDPEANTPPVSAPANTSTTQTVSTAQSLKMVF